MQFVLQIIYNENYNLNILFFQKRSKWLGNVIVFSRGLGDYTWLKIAFTEKKPNTYQ